MVKCPECGRKVWKQLGKKNPKTIWECECGHVFAKEDKKL